MIQVFKCPYWAIIAFCLINLCSTISQKNDYHWILGYDPNIPEELFGGVDINFNMYPPDTQYIYLPLNCDLFTNSVVSNDIGELVAYTNACSLFNSEHKLMINGDSLNYGQIFNTYCQNGDYPADLIILSSPDNFKSFAVFHIRYNLNGQDADLLYTKFATNEYGVNEVVLKNDSLLSLRYADQITAVKHANGKDWWVILPEGESNDYKFILYSRSGIEYYTQEDIGHEWNHRYWSSQSVISPDGRWYVRASAFNGLNIFELDRCYGALSNPLMIESHLDTFSDVSGAAFSLNSQFLYVTTGQKVVQFDMLAESIEQSQVVVAEYDGYMSPFPTNFYQAALAPDGRIYIASTSGNTVMHYIKYPDRKGLECQFMQHGFPLPVHMTFALPNVPYYRLGPEDGSTCDTLGLDNVPVAHWRYDEESPDFQFTDLSYFNPSSWHWDFGDGETSESRNPRHLFESTGEYNVCLTVSNEYGSDTECREVKVSNTSSLTLENNDQISIVPNPVHDYIKIQTDGYNELDIELITLDGIQVVELTVNPLSKIDLSTLANGVYILILRHDDNIIGYKKLVKV